VALLCFARNLDSLWRRSFHLRTISSCISISVRGIAMSEECMMRQRVGRLAANVFAVDWDQRVRYVVIHCISRIMGLRNCLDVIGAVDRICRLYFNDTKELYV
jgi:hypothetical protein